MRCMVQICASGYCVPSNLLLDKSSNNEQLHGAKCPVSGSLTGNSAMQDWFGRRGLSKGLCDGQGQAKWGSL